MKIGVDIDDTIFKSEIVDGEYRLLCVDYGVIERINAAHEDGHTIILWTGRHWNHLNITKEQLSKYGVKYDILVMAKPPVDMMIDDKAITPEEFIKMKI